MTNQFSAGEHLVGYLYQIRYALFVLLRRIKDEPGVEISIEQLDDVSFEADGEAVELLQLKHHINQRATLTSSSSDLWKTLRIWSHYLLEHPGNFNEIVLALVTTANAPSSSIASKLRRDDKRQEAAALDELVQVAHASESRTNRPAYDVFLSLTHEQRRLLVSRIHIIDNAPDILDIEAKILREIRLLERFPEAFKSRLEGWWFEVAIQHLMNNMRSDSRQTIKGYELQRKLYSLRDELHKDNLPNDFPELLEMDEQELTESERLFVEQLRIIILGQTRLRIAIGDYYRAFQQRTKWLNEGLLYPTELERYESYLVGEWRRQFEIMKEEMGDDLPDQREMARLGKNLFRWVETNGFTPIRQNYLDSFLSRGSYHILANRLKVGWHPEFVERLGHLIEQAANQVS